MMTENDAFYKKLAKEQKFKSFPFKKKTISP